MILGGNISKVYNNGKDIQKVYSYGKLVWEKQSSEDIDYSTIPFTITAVADDVSVILISGETFSFNYKINNGGWLSCNSGEYIYLKENDILYISALLPSNTTLKYMVINGLVDVSGNIMSLWYGDDFVGKTEIRNYIFEAFFRDCDIRNAKNLILPATTLKVGCYRSMFKGCTNLTTAPKLPATTLANNCYNSMFEGCTNLTTAPELPAITLEDNMCYAYMFYGCSNLNYIQANFITAPDTWAYTYNWVYGVSPTGTFVKNKNATWNIIASSENEYIGIPEGWTVEYI